MMNSTLSFLPVLLCVGVMFGGGVVAWLLTRTPLRRMRPRERAETVSPAPVASRNPDPFNA